MRAALALTALYAGLLSDWAPWPCIAYFIVLFWSEEQEGLKLNPLTKANGRLVRLPTLWFTRSASA
jgi:hypothetical protein